MIRFLFKVILLILVIFICLSFFAPQHKGAEIAGQMSEVSTKEAVGVLQNVIQDLSHFCERNSSACATGKELFSTLGLRARDGAKIAYEYLDEKFSEVK